MALIDAAHPWRVGTMKWMWRFSNPTINMAEIDDNRLVNLALGLTDDPELSEALRTSPELRERFEQVAAELRASTESLQRRGPIRIGASCRRVAGASWCPSTAPIVPSGPSPPLPHWQRHATARSSWSTSGCSSSLARVRP